MSRLIALVCLVVFHGAVFGQQVFIASGEAWRYSAEGKDLGTSWYASNYNDESWSRGISPLGFGDGDEATVVPSGADNNFHITTYFRKGFTVGTPTAFKSFTMKVKRDDGVVVYLNGIEVFRGNMPIGNVNYSTLASSSVSDDGRVWLTVSIDSKHLVDGLNVVAAEVHQSAPTSSDLNYHLSNTGITTEVPEVN